MLHEHIGLRPEPFRGARLRQAAARIKTTMLTASALLSDGLPPRPDCGTRQPANDRSRP